MFIFSRLSMCGLIEMGLPLSVSSFEVILHCEPAFHGPGLSGRSPIGLQQLCAHIVNPMSPNNQCFAPLGLCSLFTCFCKEHFFGELSPFLSYPSLDPIFFYPFPFQLYPICNLRDLHSRAPPKKKTRSNFAVARHSLYVQPG